jgi:hypothetical protein
MWKYFLDEYYVNQYICLLYVFMCIKPQNDYVSYIYINTSW